MESQSSCKQPSDQLQGTLVQDQAIQSSSTAEAMRRKTGSAEVSSPEKVVIQFGTRTIKGYLEAPTWDTVEETLRNAPKGGPKTFRIQRLETEEVEDIPAKDAKAVFF